MDVGSMIQESYGIGTGGMSALVRKQEAERLAGIGGSKSFLGMVSQAAAGFSGAYGKMAEVEGTGSLSLEERLKAKYPGLTYHVLDLSAGKIYWKTRNDYPHYLLYQEGDAAKKALEDWQPTGENPMYGSVNGKFIASKELRALGNVPPNSKAVVIHPKVQERMEQDPEYADEIMAKIDTWFTFDLARNEAFMPGASVGLSQAVVIGEDGNIENACTSSQPKITRSSSGSVIDWWERRRARHAEYMELLTNQQIRRRRLLQQQQEQGQQQYNWQLAAMNSAMLNSSVAAKNQVLDMMRGGNLLKVFGDSVGGLPTKELMAIVLQELGSSVSAAF